MVKEVKSMFNFNNTSLIFVGAIIIFIILAVFYFSRNKNVESFASKKTNQIGKKLTPKEATKRGIAMMSKKMK